MLEVRFQPVSNREDWIEAFQVSEEEDGSLIDITGAEITVVVRTQSTQEQVLTATVGDGVTLSDPTNGEFEFEFTDNDMAGLDADTYDVGIRCILVAGATQFVKGTVSVLDGVVSPP